MPKREQVKKRPSRKETPAEETAKAGTATAEAADLEATDALLDEIDEILDVSHIGTYVQKGGE